MWECLGGEWEFLQFCKNFHNREGRSDPWDTGAGAESWTRRGPHYGLRQLTHCSPKISDARDAQQFLLDIIFQNALMLLHCED